MKVLFVTMQFGRGYTQGTERYLTVLGDGLRERGHDVIYLAGDPERRGPPLELGEAVPGEPCVLNHPTRGRWAVQGLEPAALRSLLSRLAPDVVHVANPAHVGVGIVAAATELGIPVVVTLMDYWWLCPKHTLQHYEGRICDGRVTWRQCLTCTTASHPRHWLRALARVSGVRDALLPPLVFAAARLKGVPADELSRWRRRQALLADTLRSASAVIFPSRTGRELLQSSLDPARCHSIAYGLEPRWFERAAERRPCASGERPAGDITIGYAGALDPHKGVHLLLEALHRLGWDETRVRIAGGGSEPAYEQRLHDAANGLNVEFLGRLDSARMPEFFAGLDLLVVPSLWPENLPITVLEAQAMGVPVLATNVGGIAETVPPQCLFDPTAAELAARLEAWRAGTIPDQRAVVTTADEMVARTLAVYEGGLAADAATEMTAQHP